MELSRNLKLADLASVQLRNVVIMAGLTGWRMSELAALRCGDVHLAGDHDIVVRVPGQRG